MQFKISKKLLCDYIWSCSAQNLKDKVDYLTKKITADHSLSDLQLEEIKSKLKTSFFPVYQRKWQSVHRNKSRFVESFALFLKEDFTVELSPYSRYFKRKFASDKDRSIQKKKHLEQDNEPVSVDKDRKKLNESLPTIKKTGRPSLSYNEGSDKTKQRRAQDLANSCSRDMLLKALEKQNSIDESKSDECLAMFVDTDMTARKYDKLREHTRKISGMNSYPPYGEIVNAKSRCFPENMEWSETGASVEFISLIEHTIKRILKQFDKKTLSKLCKETLTLIGKWGMDGSGNQQTTSQKWQLQKESSYNDAEDFDLDAEIDCDENIDEDINQSKKEPSDSSVFIVSFCPLQLMSNKKPIWTNDTPNSEFSCRIVSFEFIKENDSIVKKMYKKYNNFLEKVKTFCFDYEGFSFTVTFDLESTMIDGKTCNTLTEQKASACCNICRVGPKLMNDLEKIKTLHCHKEYFKFGLSTLHCWIRFMEYLLHIVYNSDFEDTCARTPEQKALKKIKKKEVQQALKKNLGLPVDIVKQGGGNTNTGNVARSFFAHAKEVAECTGLDESIIVRFHNILQVLTCNSMIDIQKFKEYCLETAKLCINQYGWYRMPPTVHKVLMHGSDIISSFDVPIGWLSEEPQEANNKVFRRARATHSRLVSRKLTNKDILQYMLINSDPLIKSLRLTEKKVTKPLSSEALKMLKKNF